MREKTEKNPDMLKITHQSRERNGMVYDLKGNGHRLTLRVFPRESASDSGEWRVEARTTDAALDSVSAWGSTRAEALRDVGSSWAKRSETLGLPTFDWDAVAEVLLAVRAI
jgi:hypothetical protein